MKETPYLVLGGGLAGMAVAAELGPAARVLEAAERPGGLVKSFQIQGYWFDLVLHLLYFPDPDTESRVRAWMEGVLAPCNPEAWVETHYGTTRYPLQMHLGSLPRERVVRCLKDLADVTYSRRNPPENFEEMLLNTFGTALCETFLFPYNQKLWKRPLNSLAPFGFQWTITPPEFSKVLIGALSPEEDFRAYNSSGWYPQPGPVADHRGMELLSLALAKQVAHLHTGHRVTAIDLDQRIVEVEVDGRSESYAFDKGCISTIPLPRTLSLCKQAPQDLLELADRIPRNRVLMVAMAIRGPRPEGRGHWRYFSNPDLIFNRLVHMHEFDPHTAPPEGWGLMAEITQPAEGLPPDRDALAKQVIEDARRAGAIGADCEVIAAHTELVDPAYVVFTEESAEFTGRATAFLRRRGLHPLGRYGRWQYSSMAQVINDGFTLGKELRQGHEDMTFAPGEPPL